MSKRKRDFWRMVILSDLHCGHIAGLTPRPWWMSDERCAETNLPSHMGQTQRKLWGLYCSSLNDIKPVDVLVVNGDCIDGKGLRSGGTEQITSDREEQCRMAIQAIARVNADKVVMTYGTGYHTGMGEDWENSVAEESKNADIGSHQWVEVAGKVFDFKHHVGSSAVPYGRLTAVMRSALWGKLWAERGEQPKSDVTVRSHVHYRAYGDTEDLGTCLITPALQAAGTKYGGRRCEGTVDLGYYYFDIYKGGACVPHHVKLSRATRRTTTVKVG